MKRFAVAVLVVAALFAWSAPAAVAKKPAPPADGSTRYSVDITSADAVSTGCGGILEVERTDDRGEGATHFESVGATLAIDVPGLIGGGYEVGVGCHGSSTAPEYFRITLEDDGSVAVLWIFDVEVHQTIITSRNGRSKVETTRTDFRMGGPYADGDFAQWAQTTSSTADGNEVISIHGTGPFEFFHYQSGGHEEVDGRPLFVDVGAPTFTLDITLTEIPDQQ